MIEFMTPSHLGNQIRSRISDETNLKNLTEKLTRKIKDKIKEISEKELKMPAEIKIECEIAQAEESVAQRLKMVPTDQEPFKSLKASHWNYKVTIEEGKLNEQKHWKLGQLTLILTA